MFWSDGYRTDIEYTKGYYRTLSPVFQRFVCLMHGYFSEPEKDENVHMELGFGQGVSINIHAASTKGYYIGNDYNPNHVAFAQLLANEAHSDADLSDNSFEQLLNREDIPLCDSISIHGVWSWIDDKNRNYIVRIVEKFLKPGGIFYISYNCSAGHNHFVEWQNRLYSYYTSCSGQPLEKAKKTFGYFDEIFQKFPALLDNNQLLKRSWNGIKKQMESNNYHYLIHEYLNASWKPMSLIEVSNCFQEAKLDYIGSANFNASLDNFLFADNVKSFVLAQDGLNREFWRDTFLNNTFRKDIFMKGGVRLSLLEIQQQLEKYYFIPLTTKDKLTNKIFKNTSIELNETLYRPFIDCLYADNGRMKSFKELFEALPDPYTWRDLAQVIIAKVNAEEIAIVNNPKPNEEIRTQCQQFNHFAIDKVMAQKNINYLASPVLGQAVAINVIQAKYLQLKKENNKISDDKLAEKISEFMSKNDINLKNENGSIMTNREDIKQSLKDNHFTAIKEIYPIWEQLQLI